MMDRPVLALLYSLVKYLFSAAGHTSKNRVYLQPATPVDNASVVTNSIFRLGKKFHHRG
jgi:hypothetical protein